MPLRPALDVDRPHRASVQQLRHVGQRGLSHMSLQHVLYFPAAAPRGNDFSKGISLWKLAKAAKLLSA